MYWSLLNMSTFLISNKMWKMNTSAVLIKDVFWRQFWSSAYKGISLFSEDTFWLTYCMYSSYQTPPLNDLPRLQSVHSPSDTSVKKRVKLVTCTTSSHYTPFCQSSPWISTKRNKRMIRLFLLCSCPESQRLHLPASTSRPGLSSTHCCKHCCFSHTCFFILIIWGRWKEVKDALKTKRLQALWSVTTEQHQAASGNVYAQHFFTEETQLSWPVEPETKENVQSKNYERVLRHQNLTVAVINQELFITAKVLYASMSWTRALLSSLGHQCNSLRDLLLKHSAKDTLPFQRFSLPDRVSSQRDNLPPPTITSYPIYL